MTYDYPGSIVHTNEAGVQFELRPNFINLVNQSQFGGASLEDPHAHGAVHQELQHLQDPQCLN